MAARRFNALGETVRSAALASAHGALSDRFRAATRLYLINGAFQTTSRSERQGVARRLPIAICVAPMLDPSWILKPSYRPAGRLPIHAAQPADRKSTRLNSSHGYISYADFCLKKKNN